MFTKLQMLLNVFKLFFKANSIDTFNPIQQVSVTENETKTSKDRKTHEINYQRFRLLGSHQSSYTPGIYSIK